MNEAHTAFPIAEHKRLAADIRHAAVAVANILRRFVDPRSVLDLGCGTGTWLRALSDGGRREIFGVERDAADPADLEIPADLILAADLGQKLDLHRRFDLVVCLEVAEHLDAQFADMVVENCVRHAEMVLFSAALPGQQGIHHVNEQLPEYWAERFAGHGYVVIDVIRPLIWNDPQIPVWYRQNILLFVKEGAAGHDALLAQGGGEMAPDGSAVSRPPLAIAHPDYLRLFSSLSRSAENEADALRQRLLRAEAEFATALGEAARRREVEAAARERAEAAAAEASNRQRIADETRVAAETVLMDVIRRLLALTQAAPTLVTNDTVPTGTVDIAAPLETPIEGDLQDAALGALADVANLVARQTAAREAAEAALADAAHAAEAALADAARAAEAALADAARAAQAAVEARDAEQAALADAARAAQAAVEARDAERAALEEARRQRDEHMAVLDRADAAAQEAKQALALETAARQAALRQHDRIAYDLQQARNEIANLWWERRVIFESTGWRLTEPLRRLGRLLPHGLRARVRAALGRHGAPGTSPPPGRQAAAAPPAPTPGAPLPEQISRLELPTLGPDQQRIVFISGEPQIPGHIYRVQRAMDAARVLGAEVDWMPLRDVVPRGETIARATVMVIWRAQNGAEVSHALWVAREHGVKVLFDVDDLMFDPKFASTHIIDGIRSQDLTEPEVAGHFQRMKEVIVQVDACTCTTEELARHLRAFDRITFVLPNVFDAATLRASRLAVRRRALAQGAQTDGVQADDVAATDRIVRIGYAAGTRTHQRDFQNAAQALERIMAERPQCRLVLFKDAGMGRPLLDVAEFPGLVRLSDRIEWRDSVPLAELPNELARFDINLAPLEVGNPFCESKSELKFFEASLVEVCTIASPTGPHRRAIRDGVTGRLADTPQEWYEALRELIDDPRQRRRMAHAAYHDVLARFGPPAGAATFESMLAQLSGDAEAARAFQLALLRARSATPPEFDIPDASVVFQSDRLGDADVTVIIPLYNYAHFIEEALDSVRGQTLAQLDLIVVDDVSTDDSLQVAVAWARRHATRFNRLLVVRNSANSGLGRSRNVGFNAAETPFVLPLDADNRLRADCCASLLAALSGSRAVFAYSHLQCFGDAAHVIGLERFSALRFASSNYIDAMAMVAKWAWASVGGYTHIEHGWEDYDFWCKCVESGLWGRQVPAILAEYRVHAASMLRTSTDRASNKRSVIRQLESRHDWMTIDYRP